MITVKDVEYGGFKTDAQVDEAVYQKIRADAFEKVREVLAMAVCNAVIDYSAYEHLLAVVKREEQRYCIELSSHSEEYILKECIFLLHDIVDDFAEWYRWVHGENAIEELDEEMRFCVRKTYFEIVQRLFLFHTRHSGGGSTVAKCNSLGIYDWSRDIEFGFEVEEDDENKQTQI